MVNLTTSTLALGAVDEGDTVPVTRTAEVWAVATLNTQRQMTDLLRSLKAMLLDGSAPMEAIVEKLQFEIGRSVEAESEAWHLFNAQAERTGRHEASLEAMGPPDSITFDSTSGVPLWPGGRTPFRSSSGGGSSRWRTSPRVRSRC